MNKQRLIIISLIFSLILIIFGIYRFNYKSIDDYYDYINKEYLDSIEIPDGEVGTSEFTKYQDEVDIEIDEITNKLINTNSNVKDLYNLVINKNRSNDYIYQYMNLIDNSKDINEFIDNTIKVENELVIDIFTTISISKDLKNNNHNIVYFEPITFDFNAPSYMYNNDNYNSYVAIFKKYQIKFMKQYGYDTKKARTISDKIFKMEKDISSKSLTMSDITNVENLYNKVTKEDLQKIYSNLDIDKYLKLKGIYNEEYYSLVDINNYKTFNSYLTNENLDILKEFVKFKILESYAPYISLDYAKLVSEINNSTIGINKEYSLEDDAIKTIQNYYSDVIEKEYVLKTIKSTDNEYIEKMIKEIIKYYKNDINSLDWMSNSTKEGAIKKLDNLNINISKSNFDIISNKYKIDKTISLVENIIVINKIFNNYNLELLENDKDIQVINEYTVNAYYNPQNNSINFPASFSKFLNTQNSYYENLGTVGMIIAHEITHAFDNNGSKFDYLGNYNNWWKDEDYKKFEELTSKVSNYYSNYRINGIKVNGDLTVGENIADLGAINCITEISKEKGATKEDFKILFKSFAKMWRSKYLDNYQKLLMTSDTHSPDKIRVNATLSSNKYFYKTYNIKSWDKMYIKDSNRVKVW